VTTWFTNYKGPNAMFFQSYGDAAAAQAVLDAAVKAFAAKK